MENQTYFDILDQGIDAWNAWRKKNPKIKPDLSKHKQLREQKALEDIPMLTIGDLLMVTKKNKAEKREARTAKLT
jgi:hypothetical protein